jgi:hypothetical protein
VYDSDLRWGLQYFDDPAALQTQTSGGIGNLITVMAFGLK